MCVSGCFLQSVFDDGFPYPYWDTRLEPGRLMFETSLWRGIVFTLRKGFTNTSERVLEETWLLAHLSV